MDWAQRGMLYLLWDEAHLWGVMMLRALRAWEAPLRLVRAHELAGGLLTSERPGALVVPGGFASRKAAGLGPAGMEAVRGYVRSGGSYLGICGGSGLGLTVPGGLGLCPWGREPFEHRLQHFASGDVELIPRDGGFTPEGFPGLAARPLAPVWWPARFRPEVRREARPGTGPEVGQDVGQGAGQEKSPGGGTEVEVVAAYGRPGPGFMMADIPFSLLPRETLDDWEALYGVRLAPAFAEGDPCIVSGRYGEGRYVLSHAHLETPASPQANRWLVHILGELAGGAAPDGSAGPAPSWSIGRGERVWDHPALCRAMDQMLGVVELGREHGLFSWRESWLLGWRQGLPGAQISGVLAMLDEALALSPSDAALRFFERHREDFRASMDLLAEGLSGYLPAERLAMTLSRVDPEAVPARALNEAKATLFGPPPGLGGSMGGGLCGRVLSVLEECIHLTAGSVGGQGGRS